MRAAVRIRGQIMISSLALALALQAAAPDPEVSVEEAVETTVASGVNDGTEPTDSEAIAMAEPDIAPLAAPETPQIDIPRDTPVRLMVLNEVSTKDHEPGHRFRLRVDQPVLIDGVERIPVGATAWGELLEAKKSGNLGKSGKLSARLLYLDLDGQEIALDGETSADGKSGKGETILGVLGTGVFGLFAKGNNAKLKAGEKMMAFIAEDVVLGGAADAID